MPKGKHYARKRKMKINKRMRTAVRIWTKEVFRNARYAGSPNPILRELAAKCWQPDMLHKMHREQKTVACNPPAACCITGAVMNYSGKQYYATGGRKFRTAGPVGYLP